MAQAQAGGLERVPVRKATRAQLAEFCRVVVQMAPEEIEGRTAQQLRDHLAAGSYGEHIVATAPPVLQGGDRAGPLPGGISHLPSDRRLEPQAERWFLVELAPDFDVEGQPLRGQAFVAVNEDFAYIPRGLRVWIRELFYWHLRDARRPRYRERAIPSPHGYPPRTKLVRTEEPQYPMELHAVGGTVADTIPDLHGGELLITPNFSAAQAQALSLQKERERAQMELEGEMEVDGGAQAFARERQIHIAQHRHLAAAGAA